MKTFFTRKNLALGIWLVAHVTCAQATIQDKLFTLMQTSTAQAQPRSREERINSNNLLEFKGLLNGLDSKTQGEILRARNSSGQTLLAVAINKGLLVFVRDLLSLGADVNEQIGALRRTPLMYAIANNNVELATTLIDVGNVDFGRTDKFGKTALQMAEEKERNEQDPEIRTRYRAIAELIRKKISALSSRSEFKAPTFTKQV